MVQICFTAGAEADLQRLDRRISQRVLTKLHWLAENFDVITPEPLTGEWQGVFKLRVGDYRVLYTLDNSATSITVHFVKHRRDVYTTR